MRRLVATFALLLALPACGEKDEAPTNRTTVPSPPSGPVPGPGAAPAPWPEAAGPVARARAAAAAFAERGDPRGLLAAFRETGAEARAVWREVLPAIAVASAGTPGSPEFLSDLLRATPPAMQPDDAARTAALERAWSLIDRGRAEEARESVKALASPLDGEAVLVRAFADLLEGEPGSFVEGVGRAVVEGLPPRTARHAAGRFALLIGYPGEPEAPRGLLFLAEGRDPAEALAALDAEAEEEDLADRWARFALLLLAKRFDEASTLLPSLGPDSDPDARLARGWLAARSGRAREAATDFVAAAEVDPGDVLAHWNLAALSPRGRIPPETLEGLLARLEDEVFRPRRALLRPGAVFVPPANPEALALSLLELARAKQASGAPEETVVRLGELALRTGPSSRAVRVFLAEFRLLAGEAEEAAKILGEAFGPEAAADPCYRLRYALSLRLAGDTARAAEVFPPPGDPTGEATIVAGAGPAPGAAPPESADALLAGLRAGRAVGFDFPDLGAAGALRRKLSAFGFAPGYGFLVRDGDPDGRFLVASAELPVAASEALAAFDAAREALRGDEPETVSTLTAGRDEPVFRALRAEALLLGGEAGLAVQETAPLLDLPPWVPPSPVAERMRVIARFAVDPAEAVLLKVEELRRAWPGHLPLLEDACALNRRLGRPRDALASLRELLRRDPESATIPRIVRVRAGVIAAVAAGAVCSADVEDLLAEDAEARKLAVRAAAGLPPEEASGLLVRLAADPEAEVRVVAVRYLGEGVFRSGTEVVRAALADPSALVRGAAARSLRLLLGRDAVRELVPLLSDPDPYPRAVAGREIASASGREFGFDPEAPEAERAEAVRRVEAWLRER